MILAGLPPTSRASCQSGRGLSGPDGLGQRPLAQLHRSLILQKPAQAHSGGGVQVQESDGKTPGLLSPVLLWGQLLFAGLWVIWLNLKSAQKRPVRSRATDKDMGR